MSWVYRWCLRDSRKPWIFVRDFPSKHHMKDFLRRFWKERKFFKPVYLQVWIGDLDNGFCSICE